MLLVVGCDVSRFDPGECYRFCAAARDLHVEILIIAICDAEWSLEGSCKARLNAASANEDVCCVL